MLLIVQRWTAVLPNDLTVNEFQSSIQALHYKVQNFFEAFGPELAC